MWDKKHCMVIWIPDLSKTMIELINIIDLCQSSLLLELRGNIFKSDFPSLEVNF